MYADKPLEKGARAYYGQLAVGRVRIGAVDEHKVPYCEVLFASEGNGECSKMALRDGRTFIV